MKPKKCLVSVAILFLLFCLTACTNSSDGSSSETKVSIPVARNTTTNTPAYNKRFSERVSSNDDNISQSENNKLINKANKWVVEQNLKEYTPHFMQYVVDGNGNPFYINENVTMVKK